MIAKRIATETWQSIHALMPIPCVDLVIEHLDRVLVVMRRNYPLRGYWFLPGGRLMRWEAVWDAAKRIAFEETGLRVRVLETLGWDELMFCADPFGHGKGTHTLNIVVRVQSRTERLKLDRSQHLESRWLTRDQLGPLELLHWRAQAILLCGRSYSMHQWGRRQKVIAE